MQQNKHYFFLLLDLISIVKHNFYFSFHIEKNKLKILAKVFYTLITKTFQCFQIIIIFIVILFNN